jgi:hypothetical protein
MRRLVPVVTVLGLTCAGCMTSRPDGSPKVETTAEANRAGLTGVAQAPLRDFNVLRTRIPDVLLQAMADPYARPKSKSCAELVDAIRPLDGALGADLDTPSVDEDDLLDKGKGQTYSVMATAATGVIPFRGWVRKLSGAEQHDRYVEAAITAGAVRRAYLKGLGESKGCYPPATPSHVLAGAPVMQQEFKPRYPIRQPVGEP